MKISKQSVELIDVMGSDLSVVNAARVSFAKESKWEEFFACKADGEDGIATKHLSEKDEKLINYLAKHNHWTPFAHCFASFRIKAPIFVARQLVKHQVGLAWNEVSRRYVQEEPEFFLPSSWRSAPGKDKKQGSGADVTGLVEERAHRLSKYISQRALNVYEELIRVGVAPEQARMVLPQNTMTEWIWSGSLAAFSRVCKLRLDAHAQAETQEVASLIQSLLQPIFPVSWKALQSD